jgi:hypothetical protein
MKVKNTVTPKDNPANNVGFLMKKYSEMMGNSQITHISKARRRSIGTANWDKNGSWDGFKVISVG